MPDQTSSPASPQADRVAIVTGASRGIGRSIALELARQGCDLVLAARDAEALQAVGRDIEKLGRRTLLQPGDLRDPAAPVAVVAAAVENFGRIDIVVNNAGTTRRGPFLDLSDADFEDGFALKYFAHLRLSRAAWPHLVGSRGSIVAIAGIGGRTPEAEFAIGGSVNAAVLSLMKALAELGRQDGVQVNAVNPGAVATDRLSRRVERVAREDGVPFEEAQRRLVRSLNVTRIGTPEDVADLVAFIVSPRGRWLHGTAIDIDGGQTKSL